MSTIAITPQVVKSVIEKRFKLNDLPLNGEFRDFELKDSDLVQLRVHLYNVFGKDVRIKVRDTIYEVTDKLLRA